MSSQVASLAAELGSGDTAKVAQALGLPTESLAPSVIAGIKALEPISIDYAHLKSVAPGIAQVRATSKDGRHWTLTLVWNQGSWVLLEADPA